LPHAARRRARTGPLCLLGGSEKKKGLLKFFVLEKKRTAGKKKEKAPKVLADSVSSQEEYLATLPYAGRMRVSRKEDSKIC